MPSSDQESVNHSGPKRRPRHGNFDERTSLRGMDRLQRLIAAVPPPGPNSVGCAKCCVVFSTTGVLFLCLVGQLLTSQPVYVVGVSEPTKAAKECFKAAWIYFSIVAFSVLVLLYDKVHANGGQTSNDTQTVTANTHYGTT